jgi:N-acetylglucosaminyl-diphospho-decaprenol L-rhamnosyltransferase
MARERDGARARISSGDIVTNSAPLNSVAVVTVSYYSSEQLMPFLESIPSGTAHSVLVVNNALDDNEVRSVVDAVPGVRLVDAPRNLGYGGAMNLGVAESPESEWVLIANPDLTFTPDAIANLIAAAHRVDGAAAIGPVIYTPAGEIYPSARRLPSLRNGIGHALFSPVWRRNPWTRAYLADRENPPRERAAGWLSGACMLVRRAAFEQVGGFDEKYFMYFEDVDLCARLGRAGGKIVYAPSAVVTHVGGHSTDRINRQMIRVHHASAYKYLAARYRTWYLWPLRVMLQIALNLRGRVARS